jgi:hypothetical protein
LCEKRFNIYLFRHSLYHDARDKCQEGRKKVIDSDTEEIKSKMGGFDTKEDGERPLEAPHLGRKKL